MVMVLYGVFCFFNQKTSYEMRISDWISDVCASYRAGAERQHAIGLELAEELRHADQQQRRQHDAELAAHAAEHDDGDDHRRFDEGETLGADEALAGGKERAAEATEHGADRKIGRAHV